MDIVEGSLESKLANIQSRTSKTIDELFSILEESGLEEQGELLDLLGDEVGMDPEDASTVVHAYRQRGGDAPRTIEGDLDRIYSGDREQLRAIHDAIMARVRDFGDFEVSPREAFLDLRRETRFATVGPGGTTHVEVGLNLDHADPPERLRREEQADRQIRYTVRISDPEEVDDELIEWMRHAFERAG